MLGMLVNHYDEYFAMNDHVMSEMNIYNAFNWNEARFEWDARFWLCLA